VFSFISLSFVNKDYFRRSFGTVLLSPAITFSKSNKKNGAFGKSFLGNNGLFLYFISSKLKIACHLLYG
jgi:hypothetical protein